MISIVVVLAFFLMLIIRNNAVFLFRIRLINIIHDKSIEVIDAAKTPADFVAEASLRSSWHEAYETVSYEKMWLMFWLRLDSFYRGTVLEEMIK